MPEKQTKTKQITKSSFEKMVLIVISKIIPRIGIRQYNTSNAKVIVPQIITINEKTYSCDDWTNCTTKIQSYIGRNIYLKKNHPLNIVRNQIVDYFYKKFPNNRGNPIFSVADNINPVVTIEQNFDSLLIEKNHVSRNKSDCYYINKDYLLRGHTTAHQVDLLKSGLNNFLICGDVYRRDEIDRTHYPVFHQLDAVRTIHRDKLFSNNADLQIFEPNYEQQMESNDVIASSPCADGTKQSCHSLEAVKLIEHEFKTVLVGLAHHLFGKNIKYRWVDAYFPFTQPSWELEIFYNDQWMEVMGSGIIRDAILKKCGLDNTIGWAFGLGLERIAMILYNIKDIRLFWSNDSGFLTQFAENKTTEEMQYKAISKFSQLYMDVSFWLPDNLTIANFPVNDLHELVREVADDIVEQVIHA